ncbi:hypothetical protein [Salinibacillus xinjiangensis]|uniref:Uncharacterized protein n=1 Tax=Salinibacillus xinjiangensis TaxID=1229268 RepID=A0A6G1X7S0_9BACI|nr:hypothetical protein [Salinibacillus xinjiangensis]MRG87051.1 hypothetical protein [Salinibacillus xinjiangensis]
METFQTNVKRVGETLGEWVKRQWHAFYLWMSSNTVADFIIFYRIRAYFFLVLTPIFMAIPIFTFLGAFSMVSVSGLAAIFLLLFSISLALIFILFPFLIVYVKFREHSKWQIIWISTTAALTLIAIYWAVQYYEWLLPAMSGS